jgi:hypothetical protein
MRPAGNEAGENSLDPPARKAAEGFSYLNLRSWRASLHRPGGNALGPGGSGNMSTQKPNAAAPSAGHGAVAATGTALDHVLAALLACGRRGVMQQALTPALMMYWQCLAYSTVQQRRAVAERLHAAIRAGATTPRAWIPVALGDYDSTIVREAVLGYLGGAPVSIERRAHAVAGAFEWIRRDLSLNRVAVFVTLLQQQDAMLNERLAGLRGRLSDAEATQVWSAFAACEDALTREFIAEWQGCTAACAGRDDQGSRTA